MTMQPGHPWPLGAHWDGHGVNFAVFSAHAQRIELCLYDETGKTELRRVDLPGQPARFEAACHAPQARGHAHHHHHFHCTRCDRVFPIHACPGGMQALAPAGFQVHSHDLTLHGLCADCAVAV